MNEPRLDLEHVEVNVEPLGDPRWTRIERGMFAKLERGPGAGEAGFVAGRRSGSGGLACWPRLRWRWSSVGRRSALARAMACAIPSVW